METHAKLDKCSVDGRGLLVDAQQEVAAVDAVTDEARGRGDEEGDRHRRRERGADEHHKVGIPA